MNIYYIIITSIECAKINTFLFEMFIIFILIFESNYRNIVNWSLAERFLKLILF